MALLEEQDALNEQLIAALYATRGPILVGSVTVTAVIAGAGILAGHDPVFYALAVLMAGLGVFRFETHRMYSRARISADIAFDAPRFERLAMIGAWATAALIAGFSCYALWRYPTQPVAVLAIAQSIGYLAGISGRNTSRPLITKIQVLISGIPFTIALLLTLEPAYILIALTVLLTTTLTFSSTQIIHQMFIARFRSMKELEILANRDALTNLDNRRALLFKLDHELASRKSLTLLSVDIDHFKVINDSFGHDVGDALLVSIGETLSSCLASGEMVARMGGDEFMIVTSCGTSEAIELARRVLARIGSQRRIKGRSITATVSVGIVLADRSMTVEEALKRADIALYKAKSDGRNHFAVYTAELSAEHDEHLAFEADMREAIRTGQFQLAYQPIYNPRSGSVTLVEALLRWEHPTRGHISPATFIPVAERTGLIRVLGAWTIETAARAALTWPRNVGVSVNVSARQFESDHDLVAVVAAILRRTGLQPRRLTLEITESTLIEDAPHIIDSLMRLRTMGVRIALDDFGTGYSSLSYLVKLPIDIIKIDKSFSHEIEVSRKVNALMAAITDLAHQLGLLIIVEGVETEPQLAAMRRFSLHGIQGFIFARPMWDDELLSIIKERVPSDRSKPASVGADPSTSAPRKRPKAASGSPR
ncbi:putative bifunctional diguanylate cyclase/phosphodiesterase [Bosea lathyri]|uniref:Diguanylate cyclase (GGDEF) domain-containing protein n=1 Tax=Bosea lathyri TaxID=1036778 RepID=A0A1H5YSZ3_9HYPH|nr:EAL domain-containing protein [Bosea lathyri]SEG26436.1 diguanylate cyclase (GGDEF) domain-containing protein [Bosea lathyri]